MSHILSLILENETRSLLQHPLLDFTKDTFGVGLLLDIELPQKCHFGGKYKIAWSSHFDRVKQEAEQIVYVSQLKKVTETLPTAITHPYNAHVRTT